MWSFLRILVLLYMLILKSVHVFSIVLQHVDSFLGIEIVRVVVEQLITTATKEFGQLLSAMIQKNYLNLWFQNSKT